MVLDMNNEPVAWMLADKEAEHIRSIMAVQHDFVPKGCIEIPLYTHPAKCSKCNDTEWVCENHPDQEAHKCIYCEGAGKPCECAYPAKTLTDEEIAEEWAKFYPDVFHTHLIDFARAILRKASE